jgi:hypothetical protein
MALNLKLPSEWCIVDDTLTDRIDHKFGLNIDIFDATFNPTKLNSCGSELSAFRKADKTCFYN